jgi:hypothetical protein
MSMTDVRGALQKYRTDTPGLAQKVLSLRSGASQILRRAELSIHMVKYIHMYTQRNILKIPAPTHWNTIGRSLNITPAVLSPSSIHPPSSSH